MKRNQPIRRVEGLLLLCCWVSPQISSQVFAQTAASPSSSASPATDSPQNLQARLSAVERSAAEAKNSADNSWMLVSSALVLMMTGPGLALFYGGLVRRKNALGTMLQSFALM